MTRNDKKLDEELRSVLGDGSLDPEERGAMAQEAMREAEGAPDRAPPRRWAAVLLPAAAVLVAAVAVLFFTGKDDPGGPSALGPDAIPAAEASVAEARKMNEAALADPTIRARLEEAPSGSWAVIAHGVLVGVGTDLPALLDLAQKELPNAKHRFVFPIGEEGDQPLSPLTAPFERVVGAEFLERGGESLVAGRSGAVYYPVSLEIRVGHPFAEDGKVHTYRVGMGYAGSMVLPKEVVFPLFEIPGHVDGVNESGEGVRFRRYLVDAEISDLKIDLLVEALGGMHSAPFGHLVLAGNIWLKFNDEAMAESKRTKKPILLLTGDLERVPRELLGVEMFRGIQEMALLAFSAETPKHPPLGLKGKNPGLIVLFPVGDGPRDFRVGEPIELESDEAATADELKIRGYELQAHLLCELWEGISSERSRSPPNIGPVPLPKPLTLEEQLRMLREIERLVTYDPETLEKIREQIAYLRRRIAEKQR